MLGSMDVGYVDYAFTLLDVHVCRIPSVGEFVAHKLPTPVLLLSSLNVQ